jgi:hypothetical protein
MKPDNVLIEFFQAVNLYQASIRGAVVAVASTEEKVREHAVTAIQIQELLGRSIKGVRVVIDERVESGKFVVADNVLTFAPGFDASMIKAIENGGAEKPIRKARPIGTGFTRSLSLLANVQPLPAVPPLAVDLDEDDPKVPR